MDGVDGCQKLIPAGWAPAGDPLAHQPVPLSDEGAVPRASVLFVERHELARGGHASRAAGIGEEHQCEQSGDLALIGEVRAKQAAEADRLIGELGAHRVAVSGPEVALVVDQVDHCQHSGEPLVQVGRRRHAEGDPRCSDLRLRAGDPLRHRGLGHQEGSGDLADGQAADEAEREGDAGLHREGGVTADEDQAEPVILYGSHRIVGAVIAQHVSRQMLVGSPRLAAQSIDGFPRRGRREPRPGVGRNAIARPMLERGDIGLGGGILRDVEVAEPAGKARHHPRPLVAVGAGEGVLNG